VAPVESDQVFAETRIVLATHGQAVCNVQDTFAGHAGCGGLTDAGRTQCVATTPLQRHAVGVPCVDNRRRQGLTPETEAPGRPAERSLT
jgi:hypothetical protein